MPIPLFPGASQKSLWIAIIQRDGVVQSAKPIMSEEEPTLDLFGIDLDAVQLGDTNHFNVDILGPYLGFAYVDGN